MSNSNHKRPDGTACTYVVPPGLGCPKCGTETAKEVVTEHRADDKVYIDEVRVTHEWDPVFPESYKGRPVTQSRPGAEYAGTMPKHMRPDGMDCEFTGPPGRVCPECNWVAFEAELPSKPEPAYPKSDGTFEPMKIKPRGEKGDIDLGFGRVGRVSKLVDGWVGVRAGKLDSRGVLVETWRENMRTDAAKALMERLAEVLK